MSDTIIKIENVSKQYRLGQVGTGTISHDLNRWWYKVRGKEDPYKKVGVANDRTQLGGDYVWALKDITFEVKQGEVLGIIGKNGAGKSTLLKLLSKVTAPTTGSIKAKGKIASLLEVGTGFHPEMTGRENVFMNGTIMGMNRHEISSKMDEIVDFSGVAKYLDTPVKRYSSGMTVRLGFAIAAHLEPEILIVDEVLAVGDAEFQKKAIGKMQDVSKGKGRTVLFVSHNMASIQKLCSKSMIFKKGLLSNYGPTNEIITEYFSDDDLIDSGKLTNTEYRQGNGENKVVRIKMMNNNYQYQSTAKTGAPLNFKIELEKIISPTTNKFRIDVAIDDERENRLGWYSTDAVNTDLFSDFNSIILKIPKFSFGSGRYALTYYMTLNGQVIDFIKQAYYFEAIEGDFFGTGKIIPISQTKVYSEHEFETSLNKK